jgi:hypothetical protein
VGGDVEGGCVLVGCVECGRAGLQQGLGYRAEFFARLSVSSRR